MVDTNIPDGFIPWDDIPSGGGVLPPGMYLVVGVSLEDTFSTTGKKMYVMNAQVEEPNEYAGRMIFENFVCGSNEDPKAALASTWKETVGANRLQQMRDAAQMVKESNSTKFCASFVGCKFLVQATIYVEQKGDYAGTQKNRYSFYKVGTRPTGLEKKAGGLGAATKPKAITPSAQASPVAPAAPPPAGPPPQAAPPAPPPPSGAPAAPAATAGVPQNGDPYDPNEPLPTGFAFCGNCQKRPDVGHLTLWDLRSGAYADHVQECINIVT